MESKFQLIHDASMRILEKTGMKFFHPKALETLQENGIKVVDNTAYFTEAQIMEHIRKAPSSFEFCARNPEYNVTVGGDNVVVAPAYGSAKIIDQTGKRRTSVVDDYVKICKLYEANPLYKVNGGLIVQPNDVPPHQAAEVMHYLALTHSEKCLQTGTGTVEQLETMMEMSKIVFGDLDKARMLTIVNTNSPLMLDSNMADVMMVFGKYKQPVVISACAMAGTTGPITLAGDIVLTNAEILGALALSQMFHPGTPVAYGFQSCTADMATASCSAGSAETAILYRYAADMGRFYDLPSRGGGAMSDSMVVNGQAGYESMITFLAGYQNKINYIMHGAGIMESTNSVSYEKLIMDFEIDDMVKRFCDDVEINEDTLAESVITEIGPGGNYVSAEHTFRYCRKELLIPKISAKGNQLTPDTQFEQNIQNRIDVLLEQYQQPAMEEDVKMKLQELLKEKGIDICNYVK